MGTIESRTLDGNTARIDQEALEAFRGSVRGDVLLPSDSSYDETRKIWNAMIDRRPSLIVRCTGTADVIQTVRFARQHNLLSSVRGAGHNIAGKSLHDGALLIDLSNMKSVRVDPEAKRAYVAPGATLGDLDHETQAFGLATPTGINSTTGISGLTLGGGFGWLSRTLGLTIDNLIAADVVTADGQCLRCDADNHSDLFWAIRGGGGNFGIVTSFEFELHQVGPQVTSGPIVFPFEQAGDLLRKYRQLCAECPDELTVWTVIRGAPPLPFLPEDVHGKMVVIFAALYNGPMDAGEKAVAPLRAFGEALGDAIGPHPYGGFQAAFDPLLTPGFRNYWKSHNFSELSDELVTTLVDYAGKLPSPHSEIFIAQVGGAAANVAADATAYPHRDAKFVMNVHTRWEGANDDKACVSWARALYKATEPMATGGVYVNFLSEGEEDRVDGAYGANMARLRQVKAKYDPDNLFRVNLNISPS